MTLLSASFFGFISIMVLDPAVIKRIGIPII
jgi:hypothetical protein